MMKKAGITVVFYVLDASGTGDLKKLEKKYPGVVCTMYAGKGDDGMFTGLDRFKSKDNIVFPIIYLKNADDRLVYYSVNYVSDPLKVVAGALKMAGQKTETIGAGKYKLFTKTSHTAKVC